MLNFFWSYWCLQLVEQFYQRRWIHTEHTILPIIRISSSNLLPSHEVATIQYVKASGKVGSNPWSKHHWLCYEDIGITIHASRLFILCDLGLGFATPKSQLQRRCHSYHVVFNLTWLYILTITPHLLVLVRPNFVWHNYPYVEMFETGVQQHSVLVRGSCLLDAWETWGTCISTQPWPPIGASSRLANKSQLFRTKHPIYPLHERKVCHI